jgi:catechol 2,3-dioxygenase-like lactoylglutathione lyase family enzyme
MSYRFHHIHLLCSDLDILEKFFVEVLGAKLVQRRKFGTADGATLDLRGTTINLMVPREGMKIVGDADQNHYGYHHVGLQVDDLEVVYKDLIEKGYSFTVPPFEVGYAKAAFFEGPDHILIELIQFLK